MGVDVHLAARTKKKRSDDELLELNYRFKEANRGFGYEINPITLADYSDHYPNGDFIYQVATLSRYYGEGYERGMWPEINGAIEWMRQNFPEAEILYGGDHGFIEETPIFTEEDQKETTAMWCKSGGLGYRGEEPKTPSFRRECPFHKKTMAQYMWSGNNGAINCLACGYAEETKDGGTTWLKIKDAK